MTMNEKHTEGQVIRFSNGFHKCIAVDTKQQVAVFAPSNKTGTKVHYTKLFVLHPDPKENGTAAYSL